MVGQGVEHQDLESPLMAVEGPIIVAPVDTAEMADPEGEEADLLHPVAPAGPMVVTASDRGVVPGKAPQRESLGRKVAIYMPAEAVACTM